MNKSELVAAIAKQTGLPKSQSAGALDAVLENITKSLKKGDSVTLIGFGTFDVRHRAARQGRNPQTGEVIKVKARKVPAFKPGKGLKEAVN